MNDFLGGLSPDLTGFTAVTFAAGGGYGEIYRAFQPAFNRSVAIKISKEDHWNERRRKAFYREMSLTGQLGVHPNIVDLYHHGFTKEGQPYLVMPWYERGSLEDGLLLKGPMPVEALLRFAVEVTSALSYAHGMGVLHRDVKPANILFTALGVPVLADFGIAVDASSAQSATAACTPEHAPPEILSYAQHTERADIWSMASTLYTALAGRPPYPGDDDNERLAVRKRFEGPPPQFVRAEIPDSLCTLLVAALSPAPENRPAGAAEMVRCLQEIQREKGFAVTDPPGPVSETDPHGKVTENTQTQIRESIPVRVVPEPPEPAESAPITPSEAQPSDSAVTVRRAVAEPAGRFDVLLAALRRLRGGRPRTWQQRLRMAAISGLSSAGLLVAVVAVLAPQMSGGPTDESPRSEIPADSAPTVGGLREMTSGPDSIRITWHDSGAVWHPHQVKVEGMPPLPYLNEPSEFDEEAGYLLVGLKPDTEYCVVINVFYYPDPKATINAAGQGIPPAVSPSTRECFSTSSE